jgi:hypothetical protein
MHKVENCHDLHKVDIKFHYDLPLIYNRKNNYVVNQLLWCAHHLIALSLWVSERISYRRNSIPLHLPNGIGNDLQTSLSSAYARPINLP